MESRKNRALLATGALAAAAVVVAAQALLLGGADRGADAAPAAPANDGPRPAAGIAAEDQIALQQALNRVVRQGSSGAVAELAVVDEHGRDTWNGVAGVADRATGAPVDPQAHFRVASLSKPFVAATLLHLVEQGRADLDDTVEELLPGVLDGGEHITLRMLLSHTSGIFSYNRAMPDVREDPHRRWRPRELVEIANRRGPVFAPGTDVAYSNTNYVLVAMVIEEITGRPYTEAVDRAILTPLGLTETSIPTDSEVPGPAMHAYLAAAPAPGLAPEPADITHFNPTRWYGTAQVVSTVSDVNRFWEALLGGRVLGRPMLAEMLEVQAVTDDGYGFALGPRAYTLTCGLDVWMHSGNIPGYRTWTVHGGGRHLTLFQARYTEDPDPPAWAMIETALCPVHGDRPAPTPGDHPTEPVEDTGRGEDG
ncbi:beta-lactamase family protein [Streptomonospora sp. S1-112]|uniref:Beta-lactamase family protein n=1 Tax=Streptomonospora mangrovi TaxID=2883123 RepID=A0A9X3NQ87_9ACTN|nr:serine hydrolase domain-containing protein [Streptomonospora mangrovi]MDA0567160.1 beta-lactamase family protein [Streptomonospora mangrovi]